MTLFDAIENGDLRTLRKLMREGTSLGQIDEGTGVAPLALAAECGHLDIVHVLLRAGVDPDWGGAITPLEAAALEGHTEVAEALIAAGADIDRPVADGFTPLITAATTGHLEMVQRLIELGASTAAADDEGKTALDLAKEKGHRKIVAMLEKSSSNGHRGRRRQQPALFTAIDERDLGRLKELLEKPGDLSLTNAEGLTPLARAAELGHLGVVRALLEAGADPNAGGEATPLYCAAEDRHSPVLDHLLASGAGPDGDRKSDGRTALMSAALAGDVETVRVLLEAGADPRRQDHNGKSALEHAARAGQEQTFPMLATHFGLSERREAEAELESQVAARRETAQSAARLIDFLEERELAKAKRLLAEGLIDPDGFDDEGRTALMIAAGLGQRDLVRMLIAAGASFELRDDVRGYTALIEAVRSEAPDAHLTVALLAASAVRLDRPSRDGRTPLMHAVEYFLENDDLDADAFTARIEPLLHLGADLEARDAEGHTAWERVRDRALNGEFGAAARRKLARVKKVLERAGADVDDGGDGERFEVLTAVVEGQAGRLRALLAEARDHQKMMGDLPLLTMAAAEGHWDVVDLLVEHGVDIDSTNGDGTTVLMHAAAQGFQPLVEQLLEAGSDPKRKNVDGKTAAVLAAAEGHTDLAKLLRKVARG